MQFFETVVSLLFWTLSGVVSTHAYQQARLKANPRCIYISTLMNFRHVLSKSFNRIANKTAGSPTFCPVLSIKGKEVFAF
ncbi:MAG: hypothetical protein PWQ99_1029 [Clostridia bacterium]|nr:hypothetical protein [Clostridia bacterium]